MSVENEDVDTAFESFLSSAEFLEYDQERIFRRLSRSGVSVGVPELVAFLDKFRNPLLPQTLPQIVRLKHFLDHLSTALDTHFAHGTARNGCARLRLVRTESDRYQIVAEPQTTVPGPTLTFSLEVFLCHASPDKDNVRRLHRHLIQNGCKAWLDEVNLLGGQDWDLEIKKAVRASDIVLVCLSPAAVTKEGYVQKEIRFALDIADEKPEGSIYIVPVRLEQCEIPSRLAKWQAIDLYKPDGFESLARTFVYKVQNKPA